MPCYLSDAELEVVGGMQLSANAVRLYLFLRSVVDLRTGVAGRRRLINELAFYEWLRYEPPARSKNKGYKANTAAWRQLLKELERSGLVEYAAKGREKMVYFLPFVETGKFCPPRDQHGVKHEDAQSRERSHGRKLYAEQSVIDSELLRQETRQEHREQHTSTSITTATTNNVYSAREAIGVIPADWSPSVQLNLLLASEYFVPAEFIAEYRDEFVLYWLRAGVAKPSWETVFFRQCLGQWRRRRHSWRGVV